LNSISFFILIALDTNNLIVNNIDKVSSLVLEDLPPIGVGAVDLHVGTITLVVDIERLVVVSRSNSS
jgi:hypothetical protein